MIDHRLVFGSEAEAQHDPVVGAYYQPPEAEPKKGSPRSGGTWRGDVCIPDMIYWYASDHTVTDDSPPRTVHNYLPGWGITIGLPALDPALSEHPKCISVIDRTAMNQDAPPEEFIIYS